MNDLIPTRRYRTIFVTLLVVLVTAANALALTVPRLEGHVNDYAAMLSDAGKRQLETILTDFEQKESTQIVVLTIPSLEGDALEDFSIRTAEAWKIGQKNLDNGAILLIAKKDRKLRIEVGYGLEGRLTDLVAGRIIRNVISPHFKSGRFDRGITAGVGAMIDATRGEFSVEDRPRHGRQTPKGTPIVGVLALFFLVNALGRASRVTGAIAGALLFPIAGALFFGLGPMLLIGLVPVGMVAGVLLSLIRWPRAHGHGTSRHGGGYWGGGSGGGGFSSGGFGGFSGGGGGFGGGGASGGW